MTMKTYSRRKTKPIADGPLPQTSPAAELIAHNVDLLTQILLRLPADSIIRFKSMCKHWLSLRSDSRFTSTHSRLNPRPFISSLYFYCDEEKLESVSLNGSSTVPSLSFLRRLTEKMVRIPYTESSSRILSPDKTKYFGECGRGGHLLLIQTHSHSFVRFKICEMDKDGCRWNVKFHVDLKNLISEFPEMGSKKQNNFRVTCVVEGEEEDDFALILAIPGLVKEVFGENDAESILASPATHRDARDAAAFLCRHIWKARNKALFELESSDPLLTFGRSSNYSSERISEHYVTEMGGESSFCPLSNTVSAYS
ncbi:hypothetical protein RHSIM_Rhsim11G0068100 [Rhododendron simsii]|uniref:F-box domain-containing protein n=1 Tax=Rhododendron simsii TaxID=118357 RepID=A0A834G7B6_RHOSS|nr:hypothetical protein RHSIM_Rhsim11G0068100 [Rhododendron simsii]